MLRRTLAGLCLVLFLVPFASAEGPRALPAGTLPDDARLGKLQDYDGYFPYTPPASVEAWTRRREEVRRQLLVALGLWPMPAPTPAVILGRGLPAKGQIVFEQTVEKYHRDYVERVGLLHNPTHDEQSPVVILRPNEWIVRTAIWGDERGKEGLYGSDGAPRPEVKRLLDAGVLVAGIDMYGTGEFTAARAIADDAVDRAANDTAGFRFARLNEIDAPNFLPGIVKYGDLPALLALGAPGRTWLAGEGAAPPEVVAAAYRAAGADDRLTVY